MLDEKELYRRLDQVVPGTALSEDLHQINETEIYFERLSMSGLEEMHRYSSDARLYEFFEFDLFDTTQKTKAYIEKLLQRMSGEGSVRNAMYWFVRRKVDGYLVGTACLVELNHARQSIEWGYGVDPELWGNGYILRIQECLKKYVFETLELNRLHGITMVKNHRTVSSLLAAGMKHEGTLRDFYCKKGVYYDAWQYAMLKSDYFQVSDIHSIPKSRFSMEDVVELVSSVLIDEVVTPETSMTNSLGWDSFSHMSIMIAISEKAGVNLSPAEVTIATSIEAITSLIAKKYQMDA